MRKMFLCLAFSAVAALPLAAQDRPNLSGTWQFDSAKSQLHSVKVTGATWAIKQDDSSIQIVQGEEGAAKKVEIKCTTDGKDCKVTGDKATTSFWYNGPTLVEMETKGERVIRYRMKLSEDGKTLTVDTTSIVPKADQDDVLVFQKSGVTEAIARP
jgi:hypothetical protein